MIKNLTAGAALFALAACAGPADPVIPVEVSLSSVPGEVTLGVGQTARIAGTGASVTLVRVEDDSRCPVDATCVWQGEIVAVLDFREGGGAAERRELHSTPVVGDAALVFAGLSFRIEEVAPPARTLRPIEQDEYRVVLSVERA